MTTTAIPPALLHPARPVFTTPMNSLPGCTQDELQEKIAAIAAHIHAGKEFVAEIPPASPEPQLTALNRQSKALTLPVLSALTQIFKRALASGICSEERDMAAISSLCDKIIEAHPLSQDPMKLLPTDIVVLIFERIPFPDLALLRCVTTLWNETAAKAQINAINTQSRMLGRAKPSHNRKAAQAVDWLSNHPHRSDLRYANFTGFPDFDNDCLERVTKNCPHLLELVIASQKIQGDALKNLAHIPYLQKLSITSFFSIEKDALKNLAHITALQHLSISHCFSLEGDALKNLAHVTGLKSLTLDRCARIGEDSLRHLVHVPKLEILAIAKTSLEKDALKHLVYTPRLVKLTLEECNSLERDELKNLAHVPALQILDIPLSYLDVTKIPLSLQGITILR
ncbi:F-box protein [Estrella lausannensis]|uniref:F-box domain-containing protein n=1 Tax=Estrella lausannensis TaxID=483423 RepID=A0A0H5E778_9BACT|nr:F-box protein [Estrella lausannensis]CRX39175.1 hypothetical protein ELAC_1850 [Estrella lausannensis]